MSAYLAVRGDKPETFIKLRDKQYLMKEIFTVRVRSTLMRLHMLVISIASELGLPLLQLSRDSVRS